MSFMALQDWLNSATNAVSSNQLVGSVIGTTLGQLGSAAYQGYNVTENLLAQTVYGASPQVDLSPKVNFSLPSIPSWIWIVGVVIVALLLVRK